jgi:hypothetical protein
MFPCRQKRSPTGIDKIVGGALQALSRPRRNGILPELWNSNNNANERVMWFANLNASHNSKPTGARGTRFMLLSVNTTRSILFTGLRAVQAVAAAAIWLRAACGSAQTNPNIR